MQTLLPLESVDVDIPSQAYYNNKLALNELYEAAFLVASNFISVSLRHLIPNFYEHVSFATKGVKVLDHCYSTHMQAYKAHHDPPP
jgi:hypothetical protein